MSDGGSFFVEFERVGAAAGRLTEVSAALARAAQQAGEVRAVASTNPGFTSVDAALECATAWLDEVAALAGRVDTAGGNLADSVTTYQETDRATRAVFAGLAG